MIASLSLLPIYISDFIGALLMITISLVAFQRARHLVRLEPKNVLWTYLFWLCLTFVVFALSRSIGHVLRFVFILTGYPEVWGFLAPYSGSLNSLTFMAASVLTFFYHTMRVIIARIQDDAELILNVNENLQAAQEELHRLNRTLAQQVEKRTSSLRMSEQKFKHLFEGSKDMVYFCDSKGQICDINESGVELLGWKERDAVIGKPLANFFVEQTKWAAYFSEISVEGHIKDFEIEFQRPDGSRRYLMLTASAIYNEKGEMLGCEGIAKDLTRFKEITNQLIISEKMASVGQLAAGVAHEINTPLGIILGYSQLLEDDLADNSEVVEILTVMEKQTKTCKRIVSDLLKFSRHSKEGLRKESDINACIESVLSIMEHTLNMDNIKVQRFFSEYLPQITVNREKLRQVFVNLISNAHHAIANNGTLGIWTCYHAASQEIEIIIGDTGPGIPRKIMAKIFDPFFTTKKAGKGTGMGLSVSFGIIRDEGGRLSASSPPMAPDLLAMEMRASFHVYLPVRPVS